MSRTALCAGAPAAAACSHNPPKRSSSEIIFEYYSTNVFVKTVAIPGGSAGFSQASARFNVIRPFGR